MYWCFKLIVVTPFEHWGPSNNVLPVLVLNQKLWMLICVQRFGNKRVGKKHCILASQWYFYLLIRTEQCSKYQWLAHCADYLSHVHVCSIVHIQSGTCTYELYSNSFSAVLSVLVYYFCFYFSVTQNWYMTDVR